MDLPKVREASKKKKLGRAGMPAHEPRDSRGPSKAGKEEMKNSLGTKRVSLKTNNGGLDREGGGDQPDYLDWEKKNQEKRRVVSCSEKAAGGQPSRATSSCGDRGSIDP